MNLTECPICQTQSPKPSLEVKDHMVSHEDFVLLQCTNCMVKITSPFPHDLGKYYESDRYLSHNTSNNSVLSFLYKKVRNIQLDNKHRLIQKITQGKSLLDFGCGTGMFLHHMNSKGYKTYGIEPNHQARENAIRNSESPVFASLSELPETQFDVITLWHVLEHLEDPVKSIQSFGDKLKSHGMLVIAVPNYQSFDAHYYGSFWAGYDVPRHLYHFTQTTLRHISYMTPFSIQSVLPMKYDSFYVSLLSEEYMGTGIARYVKAIIQGTKSNIMASRTGEYSSLIYVLQKDA